MTVNELIEKLQSLPEDWKDREIYTNQAGYGTDYIDVEFEIRDVANWRGDRVKRLMMEGKF